MKRRDFFIQHIKKSLIGPGADTFGVESEKELLSSYPLQIYYSGILFPERAIPQGIEELETSNGHADFVAPKTINDDNNNIGVIEPNGEGETKEEKNTTTDTYKSVNSYFPTNCGLTFCVDNDVKTILVEFSAGAYQQTQSRNLVKVVIVKNDYHALIEVPSFPFLDNLKVEEKDEQHYWLFIAKEIAPTIKETKRKIRDYKNALRKLGAVDNKSTSTGFKRLDLLTSGVVFQRRSLIPLVTELQIDLTQTTPVTVFEKGNVKVVCFLKVLYKDNKKYVKILLKNQAEKHPITKFSYGNELLNEKAIFQVGIKIKTSLLPFKDKVITNRFDQEASIINYQYRHLKSYGIGHGTAVLWEESKNPSWIKTSFTPETAVRSVSNGFRPDELYLEKIADIKNLSIWTKWKCDELCDNLERFISAYHQWIEQQQNKANQEGNYPKISQEIIGKQIKNYNRLKRNIQLLRVNKTAYDTFLLTNTAMYLQLVISIDKRFGKQEKELYEILDNSKEVDYQSLSFFKEYQPTRRIAYRPFQLAFLLLNLEGIVHPEIEERTEVVDLLWFPTGGGKTEAYLAVTAFTILWRRIKNSTNFEGVSVIMRYTLRLLTAQQFERASRLIVALEFLNRRQNEIFTPALFQQHIIGDKDKPISIGMWVGGATTPNSIEKASDQLNGTDENNFGRKIQKLNTLRDPVPKNADSIDNIFQISACPWCGCKTISKAEVKGNFVHAFVINKKRFHLECINTKCDFNNFLPIDVVDDSLYRYPPTLLFATVDKFAQLSHREEGHRFFNSLNSQLLPPDLIIQDELHLLNGPLGSIVGLFEFMVELLCTKGKKKPKIIASTATTRNTQQQIANLYGGRKVNIFPPLGITHDDNYFSFTDTKNKGQRTHIGFMPTGKTSMDSQVRAVLPQLLFARILLYKDLKLDDAAIDNYWTIVSYYNSLKDVGKVYNKVNDEVVTELKRLHEKYSLDRLQYNFNNQWIINHTRELTSRIESSKIKNYLNELSIPFQTKRESGANYRNLKSDVVSLVLASNMLSVGIDVSRLNIMLMNGQPKNIAEYIQASSRVAREHEGLVVNLLDANRAREKSYFENYLPFHQAYYKYVEPLTVTPFTNITFDKVLNSIFVCYVRHIKGLANNEKAHEYKVIFKEELLRLIEQRLPETEKRKLKNIEEILDELSNNWLDKIESQKLLGEKLTYKNGLIEKSQEYLTSDEAKFALMNSMREIDTDSVIDVNLYKNLNNRNEK